MPRTNLNKAVLPVRSKKKMNRDYDIWVREMEQLHRSELIAEEMFQTIVADQLKRCYAVEENLTSSSMLFLFDNTTTSYKFVSSTAEQVLGYSSEEIVNNGFEWIFTLLSEEERMYKNQLMGDIFGFLAGLSPSEVRQSTVRYDIVGLTKSGEYKHFLEELMFPVVNETGAPILITCFVHLLGDYGEKHVRKCQISNPGLPGDRKILFEKTYPIQSSQILSARELEVLSHFAEGLSTAETAKRLHLAVNTIKTHRKNILFKLDAKNTTEALKRCYEKNYL
jgi:DNA-binding CsgD family transcriptional regulator/PAS domain-containing protein